jgi:hypothetical protein
MADNSGGAGSMLGVIIGGVLVVMLVVFLFGGFGWSGTKGVDVTLKAPNVTSPK